MLEPKPVEIIYRDCPFCDKDHDVEHHIEIELMPVKGEDIECVVEYFRCPITDCEDGDSWNPAGIADENLLRARDAYRVKHGLLTSSQIIDIQKKYDLTQEELSNLLGWEDTTVSKYETKLIQEEAHDNLLKMIMDNPSFALSELEMHKAGFSDRRYEEIKSKLSVNDNMEATVC